MSEQNINFGLNSKECLKATTKLTETIYTDICTGAKHVIEHGFTDYMLQSFLTLFALFLLTMCTAFIKMVFFD